MTTYEICWCSSKYKKASDDMLAPLMKFLADPVQLHDVFGKVVFVIPPGPGDGCRYVVDCSCSDALFIVRGHNPVSFA